MRKHRFYTKRKNLRHGSSILLEGFDANHIRKSLRLKKGDEIYIFNGEKEFKASLTLVSREAIMAVIHGEVETDTELTKELTVFQALTKSSSFELVLEKLTELGVTQFVPFESNYSVIKSEQVEKKASRWEKIILSAAKQSERISVPNISKPIQFTDISNNLDSFELVIFFTPKRDLKDAEFFNLSEIKKFRKIAFIIGPEGGFSPEELELAKTWDIKFASLGNTILRSETASIAAASILTIL